MASVIRVAVGAVAALALLAIVAIAAPPSSDANAAVGITIVNTVAGGPGVEAFQFTVTPEVDGCSAEQTVTGDAAGGQTVVPLADFSVGPLSFDSGDFAVTPVFSTVSDFAFDIDLTGIASGTSYVNPPFGAIDYLVRGELSDTPSGFPAFRLERTISFEDFVSQDSDLTFEVANDAELSDGLQIADLAGTDAVFVLDAQEIGTGRYHPPILTLRADGTGQIQNSRNQGGVNPVTMQEVDVQPGEEYITNLAFDPAVATLAEATPCTYTVMVAPTAGFVAETTSFAGITSGAQVDFVHSVEPVLCNGQSVTIDLRTNGGDGTGTAGDDVILGTSGDDVIDAGDGDDLVCAGEGNDAILGGNGNDTIFGEGGRDVARGNAGRDIISGGPGDDRLLGGIDGDTIDGDDGNDYLGGFGGADTLNGGPGNEVIFGGFGPDVIDAGPGDDEVHGLVGDDIINGGDGDDELDGDRGNDTINGDAGNDVLRGGNANDVVDGGPGSDSVNGGKGNDTLRGGDSFTAGGVDTCVGNKGFDTADSNCEMVFGVP